MQNISYRNDVFFKYAFGTNDHDSLKLRRFLLSYLLNKRILYVDCSNPEIIPSVLKGKTIILDTYIERHDMIIDIEMQNTPLNSFQYKRFQ